MHPPCSGKLLVKPPWDPLVSWGSPHGRNHPREIGTAAAGAAPGDSGHGGGDLALRRNPRGAGSQFPAAAQRPENSELRVGPGESPGGERGRFWGALTGVPRAVSYDTPQQPPPARKGEFRQSQTHQDQRFFARKRSDLQRLAPCGERKPTTTKRSSRCLLERRRPSAQPPTAEPGSERMEPPIQRRAPQRRRGAERKGPGRGRPARCIHPPLFAHRSPSAQHGAAEGSRLKTKPPHTHTHTVRRHRRGSSTGRGVID